jgi:hypothetical protein
MKGIYIIRLFFFVIIVISLVKGERAFNGSNNR